MSTQQGDQWAVPLQWLFGVTALVIGVALFGLGALVFAAMGRLGPPQQAQDAA